MSDDDLFSAFESDRTVIKPTAGRARPAPSGAASAASGSAGASASASAPGPATGGSAEAAALPELPAVAGLNPLLQAAMPLLRAAPRIRSMLQHPNPAALRASLVEGMRQFEAQARAAGLPNEQLVAGRYALCTLLDESASSTPWGGSGVWSSHSLLVLFHNEAWGGEKVFQLMGKLAEDVPRHRNLLELMYAILALGFEGRYRVLDNGRAQLDSVRERLGQILRQHTPAPDKELSAHWVGAPRGDARLRDGIPVWVVAVAAALLLVVAFVALRFSMQDRTDTTFAALGALDVPKASVTPPPPPQAAPVPRLAGFLQPEIAAGLVEVRDLADRSVVTIRGDGFFDAGSADVAARVRPLMGRIAQALNEVPGQVLITGHTDNQPIRSLRYPSNWHLSQDRANAVMQLLSSSVKPERLRAEGRADSEPLAANATPADRARNRRVEITLFSRG